MPTKIEELWVYPVKSCQGVRVKKAALTPTGLENDRAWCVVDEDGVNVSKFESVSGRKLPALAKICVSFSDDVKKLYLNAQGMDQLEVPVSIEAYKDMPDILVECSGKSTTAKEGEDGGWSLGFIPSKRHSEGSEWLTKYLNSFDGTGKKRFSGKTKVACICEGQSNCQTNVQNLLKLFVLLHKICGDFLLVENNTMFATGN